MLRTLKTFYTAVKTCDIDDVIRYHLLESSEEYPTDGKKVREALQNGLNALIPSGKVLPTETVVTWSTLYYVPMVTEMEDAIWLANCHKVREEPPVLVGADSTMGMWAKKMGLEWLQDAVQRISANDTPSDTPSDTPLK